MAQIPFLGASSNDNVIVGGGTQLVVPIEPAVVLSLDAKEDKNKKGVANGYAPLDANAKVPAVNLPDTASLDAEVDAKITTHNSATTSVHGIANTANLVLTNDSRLSDSRTPTAHTHTKSEITDFTHAHAISDVTNLQSKLDTKQEYYYTPVTYSSDYTIPSTLSDTGSIERHFHFTVSGTPTYNPTTNSGTYINFPTTGKLGDIITITNSRYKIDGFVNNIALLLREKEGTDTSNFGSLEVGTTQRYVRKSSNSAFGNWTYLTPAVHSHGNISSAGAVGTTANLPLITTTSGVVTTGTFGTTPNSFCQGNDSRLSDSRAPTAHKSSHATGGTDALSASDIGAVATTDTRIANTRGGSIDTRAGAVTERTYETGDPENPFESETSLAGGAGGTITLKGGDGGFDSIDGGIGGNSGSINLSGFTGLGGDSHGGHGGSITLMGSWDGASAGSINLNAGGGGADNHGGSIISTGNNEHRGGTLNMSAGDGEGGSINTSSGGSINTSNGGGSINTKGSGSIQLGQVGTRTTLNGSAIGGDKIIALPNASGTIALTSGVRDTIADYLYDYAGIDSGYVITNIKFRQTLSGPIWQAQTSPITAEFNRDATSAKNNAFTAFTRVQAGGYDMFWQGSELGVGTIGEGYNEPMLVISHQKLLSAIRNVGGNPRTIFNTYDFWSATDYNDYLPVAGYQYCEVTWIATNVKSNFSAGKLVLGNTDRTNTIQTTSTAPRTISIPDATPQGGTFALWPRVSYGGILSATGLDGAYSIGSGTGSFLAGTYPIIQAGGSGGVLTVAYPNGQMTITVTSAGTGYVDGIATRAGGSRYNLVTQATLPAPANLPVITTTGGNISAGAFGTTANTFCQGNDSRLSMPFTFRTLFATTSVANPSDTRYFSTIDAVGAVSGLELRNFEFPYLCKIVACSSTIYNTSGVTLASGGTVAYNLVTKATEASTSSSQIYGLLNNWTLAIAGGGMTSYSSILASPITISAGTNLASQVVFTNLAGASLRGELTLYIVPTL